MDLGNMIQAILQMIEARKGGQGTGPGNAMSPMPAGEDRTPIPQNPNITMDPAPAPNMPRNTDTRMNPALTATQPTLAGPGQGDVKQKVLQALLRRTGQAPGGNNLDSMIGGFR